MALLTESHAGFGAPQMDAFMDELGRFDTHGTLCTPLLLELMLSEYVRHETEGGAIQLDGAAPLLPARPHSLPPSLPSLPPSLMTSLPSS